MTSTATALSRAIGPDTYAAVYDRTDELVSISRNGGFPLTATYTATGDLTADPENGTAGSTITYTYDLAHRLTSITPAGGATTTVGLDALGRPVTRTTGSSVDTYSYLGTSDTVVRIANTGGTGAVTDSISDPAGDRLGTKTGSTVAWLTPDLHGSIAAALAQSPSSVTDAIRYDGYGQTVAVWPSGGSAATTSWKYQGRLDLSPSSIPLYAAGARDYAPGLGMFTSLDTFAGSAQDPLSMNRFLYAEANPATLVDPSGHMGPKDDQLPASGSTTPTTCHYPCGTTTTAATSSGGAGSTETAPPPDAPIVSIPLGPRPSDAFMRETYNRCLFAGSAALHLGCMRQTLGDGWSMIGFREYYGGEWDEDPLANTVTTGLGLLAFGLMGRLPTAVPATAIPGGGLWANELRGGHTIESHISLSDADLLQRLAAESLRRTSSFYNPDIAESAINSALKQNMGQIRAWLASTSSQLTINTGTPGLFVGRTATAATGLIEDVQGVRIVLVRTPSLSEGYRILTAFPQPLP